MPTAQVLKQVREQRGLDVDDVAATTHISAKRLRNFELGEGQPSFRQLDKLAEVYGLPSYLLGGRDLPNLSEPPIDYRRPNPQPAHLSAAGLRKLWNAKGISEFTHQLSVEVALEPPAWASSVPSGNPTNELARRLRDYFNDWARDRSRQFAFVGPDEQTFLASLRLFFEAQGTVVNQNEAPWTDFLGFYTDPDGGSPLIFVNRSISSRKAQLFTLLHEYAHRLLGASGVSNPFVVNNSVERACNKFAAEFIAPMPEFRSQVEELPKSTFNDTTGLVRAASRRSFLSMHATAIRLVEAGYLTQPQLRAWESIVVKQPRAEKDEEKEADGDSFGYPHAKRVGELGYLPTYLAAIATSREIVDSLDVQRGLTLSEGLQARAFALATRRMEAARK